LSALPDWGIIRRVCGPSGRSPTKETPATPELRVGIGHDTHRLGPGGPLRLGGIDIPHDREALGHSDADALLHAVTDALLGALALDDIGQMFPDDDPANRRRDSAEMLRAACDAVAADGWRIGNLDCIVHAQRPKLAPYREAIRHRIAEVLQIDLDRVSIKAKTGEGVGLIGREEVLMTQCVVLLERMKNEQ
jgi:2-C-methyl-D-erythritol 2,4-cyclodiphosphate synthase